MVMYGLCREIWQGVETVDHPLDGKRQTNFPEKVWVAAALKPWLSVCSWAHCIPKRMNREESHIMGQTFQVASRNGHPQMRVPGPGAAQGRCSCIHIRVSRGVISQRGPWYRGSGIGMFNPHLQCTCIFFAPYHIPSNLWNSKCARGLPIL